VDSQLLDDLQLKYLKMIVKLTFFFLLAITELIFNMISKELFEKASIQIIPNPFPLFPLLRE